MSMQSGVYRNSTVTARGAQGFTNHCTNQSVRFKKTKEEMVQDVEQIGEARVQKLFDEVRVTEYEFLWNCSIRANGNSVPITSSQFATKDGPHDYRWTLKFDGNSPDIFQECSIALFLESGGPHGADNKMSGSLAVQSLNLSSSEETPVCIFHQDEFIDLCKSGKKMEATISNPILREVWERLFDGLKVRLKIGIVWEDSVVQRRGQLSIDLERLYVGQHSADVTFVFNNKEEIKAHRLILTARSPVFQAMLQSDRKEHRVEMKDVDPKIFEKLLRYVYTGQMNLKSTDNAVDVMMEADRYGLVELRDYCVKKVMKRTNVANAADHLVVSDLLGLDSLKAKAIQFIIGEKQEFLKTEGYKNLLKSHVHLVSELFEESFADRECCLRKRKLSE